MAAVLGRLRNVKHDNIKALRQGFGNEVQAIHDEQPKTWALDDPKKAAAEF
jgi:hypothetical protein